MRRGRGVVAGDHVDVAGQQVLPETVARREGAQRRRALGGGADARHVIFAEVQVVRAGLDGNIRAPGSRFKRRRHAASRADVNDVQA